MTQQELIKVIVTGVGALIDARAKTTEINLKGYIDMQLGEVKKELQEVRHELKADIQEVRHELKTDIQEVRHELHEAKIELKADIHTLRVEVGTKITDHAGRITKLEEKKLAHRN